MTQNTEQKVRTREYGEAKALKIQRELRLSSHDLPALARHARQCFEEGAAEEQRRKDAEIASLKDAEQLARSDAEASKARAEKLKKVALDVLQVCQRSKMGPSDLGYVTNMIRAALTREGGV
ncbi:hypothetical protein [Gluconobacter sp. DsW_058]|uniref:hypothetical protein n=1 Tax=Gluconobacter sp. DsW_058 TaxID=1511210 RepID=UPI000A3D2B2F|nr:hypothetical protein [Gluconobacter sp. DsW_058]OUJ09326.1 hypothetical protein HK24_00770 [Gluconobacter sp. DsW_058]